MKTKPEVCNCGKTMVWSEVFNRWVCECGNCRYQVIKEKA